MSDPTANVIELDGRRLAWRTGGEGRPLLLINGYAAASLDWDPVLVARLEHSFTVIRPDNRGIAGSELGDPAELSVEAMAGDMASLLDALGLEQVTVAGWSMGGFVAQALARLDPARIAALVLMSTHPGGSRSVRAAPGAWKTLTDHSGTPREQASRLIALLFPPAVAPQIDRDFGELVAAARAQLRPETLGAQEAAILGWYRTEPRVEGAEAPPVLAAAGSEDVVVPPENLERLAACWPRCRTERFIGGGHAFMAQEPERLAALVAAFASD